MITPRSKNIIHRPFRLLLRKPMLDMLKLHHPLLLLQQHRPLGIAQKTPIEESSGLLDTVASVFSERDDEDIAELFESQAFGFGHNT
jgi:hypothetical protein